MAVTTRIFIQKLRGHAKVDCFIKIIIIELVVVVVVIIIHQTMALKSYNKIS